VARPPAPSKRPAGRSPLTPFYAILGVVALLGLGAIAYQLFAKGGDAATAPVEVQIDPTELSRVQGVSLGNDNAPVVIYEFADFQCPACGQFASFITPLIKERLVQPGTVKYVYYDFPLNMHPHAFLAARSARCAQEQGKFWEYHDALYGRQPTWSAMRDATDFFIELGNEVGVDEGQFEECVQSDKYAEEVTRSLKLGESLGVRGTPTLFINGKRLPNIPSYQELEALVQQEAGMGAPAAAPATAPAAPGPGGQ